MRDVSEFVKRLSEIHNGNLGDSEVVHHEADAVLLEALRALGGTEVADAWEALREDVGFWYA